MLDLTSAELHCRVSLALIALWLERVIAACNCVRPEVSSVGEVHCRQFGANADLRGFINGDALIDVLSVTIITSPVIMRGGAAAGLVLVTVCGVFTGTSSRRDSRRIR